MIALRTDIRNVKYRQELKLLQDTTPILVSLLLKLPFSEVIPDDVCTLISQLCDLVLAPFQPRSQTFPSPPADSELTYFPNLSMVCGVPVYSADQSSHRQSKRTRMPAGSTLQSSNHPTLTPGIFTIYCLHRVCCGFEVMKTPPPPPPPPVLSPDPTLCKEKGLVTVGMFSWFLQAQQSCFRVSQSDCSSMIFIRLHPVG